MRNKNLQTEITRAIPVLVSGRLLCFASSDSAAANALERMRIFLFWKRRVHGRKITEYMVTIVLSKAKMCFLADHNNDNKIFSPQT